MKISLVLSGVIVLAAAPLLWREYQSLVVLQKDREILLREASELGIHHDAEGKGALTKQAREKRDDSAVREEKARDFAKRLSAFALEMKAAEAEGKESDDFRKQIFAMIGEMLALDPSQLKIVVAELRNNREMPADMRDGLIGFAIMTLAESQPESALALFNESPELMKGQSHAVFQALNRWAQKDSTAALAWIRENSTKFPDLIGDQAKQGVLTGTAMHDPKLAFQMSKELGLKNPLEAGEAIANAANTPEQRISVLSALREHLATVTDAEARNLLANATLARMTSGVVEEGYASATAWLEKAQLTPEEKTQFARNLRYHETQENTGKWLEWMAKEGLSHDQTKAGTYTMVQQWTKEDHKAVGTWLNEVPDSPVRQIATRTYAQQVAPYEPQTAALWAKTLPPGKERTETMERIYREWKKQDEASAAAFAREQGVEK